MANLSAKELGSITDQLNYEMLLVKKCKTYAASLTDAALKQKCEDLACKHQSHYDTLMGHLY